MNARAIRDRVYPTSLTKWGGAVVRYPHPLSIKKGENYKARVIQFIGGKFTYGITIDGVEIRCSEGYRAMDFKITRSFAIPNAWYKLEAACSGY